ncbi:MAG: hypothetical protein FWE30_05690 [Bacteroidales bacterium]|nr:hypothetical protein [Bacteroidales bacterium]
MRFSLSLALIFSFSLTLFAQDRFSLQLGPGEDINTSTPRSRYVFPEFRVGTVVLRDGATVSAQMNYDMLREDMLYIDSIGIMRPLPYDPAKVLKITFENREFVYFQTGYAEVLAYSGNKALLMRRMIAIEMNQSGGAYGSVLMSSSMDPNIRADLEAIRERASAGGDRLSIVMHTTIYLRSDRSMFIGGNRANFEKMFGNNHKAMIRDYVRNNKLNLKTPTDVVALFDYLADNQMLDNRYSYYKKNVLRLDLGVGVRNMKNSHWGRYQLGTLGEAGFRWTHHLSPHVGLDMVNLRLQGILGGYLLQTMVGVRGYSPDFTQNIKGYAALGAGYGKLFTLDDSGFAYELEVGLHLTKTLAIGLVYNTQYLEGTFSDQYRGFNSGYAGLRVGFNF